MAMDKFANAHVKDRKVDPDDWFEIRQASVDSKPGRSKTASVDFSSYNPDEYLLTHATIIASVDVDEVEGVKTGEVKTSGSEIYRPHPDFHITPDTSQYVNHNGDAWERDLLLSTYRTFVGAENYVEHVQVPELSKGKVVDAVARDLGDTVYIDILVATDRKHDDLIRDIVSGRISTMSMGCTISYSICTRCGNVAREEHDLCEHVLRQKGSKFIDSDGNERVIAELCGHKSDPASVKFIEASWVANPAFEGAVKRNVLIPEVVDVDQGIETMGMSSLIERAFTMSNINKPNQNVDDFFKTASAGPHMFGPQPNPSVETNSSLDAVVGFGRNEPEEEEDSGGDEGAIEELVDDVKDEVKERIFKQLKDEIQKKPEEIVEERSEEMPEAESAPNDSVIESKLTFEDIVASTCPDQYTKALVLEKIRKSVGSRGADLAGDFRVTAMYLQDSMHLGSDVAEMVNHCITRLGAVSDADDFFDYLTRCAFLLERIPTARECTTILDRASNLS